MATKMTIDGPTAYSKEPGTYRKELTEVGRGTPMGELMRRYWQVVALSRDATVTPKEIRLLGEDLVLFRDGQSRAGLVHARCAHRGTTLYYGKVEDRGIRCCYHGWLYDVEGRCLEQPCEPDLGARTRDKVRQPWYPVEERYGLIFAYMGPPGKMPILPRYECLENLEEGEFIEVDDRSIGTQGDVIMPCNWLQHFENLADPYHVPVLHGSFTGTQFNNSTTQMPLDAEFRMTERGVEARTNRPMEDGRVLYRVSEAVLPTLRAVANPFAPRLDEPVTALGWIMPIDDTHLRIYTAGRAREKGVLFPLPEAMRKAIASMPNWFKMTEAERRDRPGDWEAQTGQGPITFHSEEHLLSSDKGVVMVRRMLRAQLKAVAEGKDPINVSFDPKTSPVKLSAGNYTGSAPQAPKTAATAS
jgi:phenylpropionate dioxygenase-like ring-hydroxylating dioxygenase large terminal subunit